MKNFKIIVSIVILLTATSCEKNFLDRAPGVALSEEKVFSDPVLASQFANNAYNFLVDDYARFNNHRGTTSQASDEAVSGNTDVSIRTLNQGLFHDHYERGGSALNDIGGIWERAYAGIRITNVMLGKMSTVPWTPNQDPTRIEGEMKFIRAFLYFELIKRFGGVPIVDKALEITDNADLPRNTYQECVDFIVADLDQAITNLPPSYDNASYGRATSRAAMALKSRVLLYAASALHNTSNDLNKWKAAADAAKALMDLNAFTLHPTYSEIMNVAESPEYIMIKIRGPRAIDGMLLDFIMSPGSGGAQGSMNPTQNHVDMYEMQLTGKPITDATSGYNPANPYAGRDPRFYANILYNDAPWQGRRMQMWNNGNDFRENNIIYTATRYYCRKMWPEVYTRNTTARALFNYIFFRYAEVLLNYAEAQNEFLAAPDNTVYNAINTIRARVSMPNLPLGLTKAQMREAIRHERAVELAFEDFRWYDIMRWKIGVEVINKPVMGMNVVRNSNGSFTYNPIVLPSIYQKTFADYMHLYPIPRTEIFKSKGVLTQNPGWE